MDKNVTNCTSNKRNDRFRTMLEELQLHEISSEEDTFLSRDGRSSSKLDCFLVSNNIITSTPFTRPELRGGSTHAPVFMEIMIEATKEDNVVKDGDYQMHIHHKMKWDEAGVIEAYNENLQIFKEAKETCFSEADLEAMGPAWKAKLQSDFYSEAGRWANGVTTESLEERVKKPRKPGHTRSKYPQ